MTYAAKLRSGLGAVSRYAASLTGPFGSVTEISPTWLSQSGQCACKGRTWLNKEIKVTRQEASKHVAEYATEKTQDAGPPVNAVLRCFRGHPVSKAFRRQSVGSVR